MATLRVVMAAGANGLLLRAIELLEPGEVSEPAEGEPLGNGASLVGGVSDRSDECDLREMREARGSRPATSSGELPSESTSSRPPPGDATEGDEPERRYFAGSLFEMASASVCFLNLVSGLSIEGLSPTCDGEILLEADEGVGRPERMLGVVGMPDMLNVAGSTIRRLSRWGWKRCQIECLTEAIRSGGRWESPRRCRLIRSLSSVGWRW